MIVGVTSSCTGETDRTIHLVPEFLQHPHELIIHFKDSAAATASHFGLAEIECNHIYKKMEQLESFQEHLLQNSPKLHSPFLRPSKLRLKVRF